MANPQTEKGFIKIASGKQGNDILMALISANLTSTEYQIVLVVMRKTWGWNKKQDWISYSQFMKITGKSRISIWAALKKLVKQNILVKQTELGKMTLYQVNKDFESWVLVKKSKLVKVDKLVKKTEQTSKVDLTRLVKKTEPTKDIITKDTIQKKYAHLKDLTEKDFKEIAVKYKVPIAFVRSKFDDMELWMGEKAGRGRGRNWRLTLMNWVKRDSIKIVKEAHGQKSAIDARAIIAQES